MAGVFPGAQPGSEAVAIVGMAVNMPGAPSVSKLWEILEEGVNTITEVPSHRFNIFEYTNPSDGNTKMKRTIKAHTGNFIDDPDLFDNAFFRISPREARSMDPQQRILLHTAYEALENAGYVPNATRSFQQATFGCYIGAATSDYVHNLHDEIDVYYSTGTLRSFLSGRISYAMQFSGPSTVIDTSCSSSIVAVHQACRALLCRDCNAALAGGVNIISSPDMMIGLDRGHFLSPSGQCKVFDASADGYSRSEGCGVFVLKRLSDAIAEHDHILGIIRGVEVNHNGLASSITRPHIQTQKRLFQQLLEKTGVDRDRVNVVEAHGTGTQAGDPSEIESIRGVLASPWRTSGNPLHVTAIKSNIGHLEAASGAASLAKLLLMLRHEMIPRQINLVNLNPLIAPLGQDHVTIDINACKWSPSHEGMTRMAILNNFGASGSNAALLLEEFPKKSGSSVQRDMAFIIGLSAKTEIALDELRSRYVEYLECPANATTRLSDIAYTATARRQVYPYRLAVSASERHELLDKLRNASVKEVKKKSLKTVFVFSGQGSQHLGMGSSLYCTSPLFKRHIDHCHSVLVSLGFPGVLPIIIPGREGSGLSVLDEFQASQAAVFSLDYSLAQVWLSWGSKLDAVVGHSLGEYTALVIAGVITLENALIIVGSRARLMVQKCAPQTTGMIAVNLGSVAVSEILRSSRGFSGLVIACYNSRIDCVVAGPLEELESLKAYLDSYVRCKNVFLDVPFGYHTTAMSPLVDELDVLTKNMPLRAPTIPIVSNVSGDVICAGDTSVFTTDYFSRHCTHPVLFDKGVGALLMDSAFADMEACQWIEIGPHTTTLSMLKSNPLLQKNSLLLGSLKKGQDAWTSLTGVLCQLYTSGAELAWRKVFSHVSVTCIDLPSYPFSKTRFWIDYKERSQSGTVSAEPSFRPTPLVSEFSMLYSWGQFPSSMNNRTAVFETPIDILGSFIRGHRIGDHSLCPASVYQELALSGVQMATRHISTFPSDGHAVLRVTYSTPLVYDENIARTVRTTVTLTDETSGTFRISSYTDKCSEDQIHCFGEFVELSTANTVTKFQHHLPILLEQIASVTSRGNGAETFSTRTAYEIIFPRVVQYAKEYHTMQSLMVDPSVMKGYAIVRLPSNHDRGKFVVHPVFMDTLLHVAGFVANMHGGVEDAFICSHVDSVEVVPKLVNNDSTYGVLCRNVWSPNAAEMTADAYAVTLDSPQTIVGRLESIRFRRVRLNSLTRTLLIAAGNSSMLRSSKSLRPECTLSRTGEMAEDINSKEISDIQSFVVKVVAETCGMKIEQLDLDTDLSLLGVDSLMTIEASYKLQEIFPHITLNSQTLSMCNTATDIVRKISAEVGRQSETLRRTVLTSEEGSSSEETLSANDKVEVKAVMAFVQGDKIDGDADLKTSALDSLVSVECLRDEIALAAELPQGFFTTYSAIGATQNFVSGQRNTQIEGSEFSSPANPILATTVNPMRFDTIPVALQHCKGTHNLPLFLIHDGSGLINYYDRLTVLDRDVWGIHNPNFMTGHPWDGVMSMAKRYSACIMKTTSGPVLLGGWSFGGVVAFEIARQMLENGVSVKGVILIDSPSPVNHVPLSDCFLDSIHGRHVFTSDIGHLVKDQLRMNSKLLGMYDPHGSAAPYPPLAMLRSRDAVHTINVETVPLWLRDRSNPQDAVSGWEDLVGEKVRLWDIPGNHFQPFRSSNIEAVSLCIADACRYLQNNV